jgi:hypothetical protein
MLDELLSNVPNSQRNRSVLDNIHLLIERYKQLRSMYSKFDKHDNVYDAKVLGISHKPLIEHIEKMDKKLQWIVPVVANRRKIYIDEDDEEENIDLPEITIQKTSTSLRIIEKKQLECKNDNNDPTTRYESVYNGFHRLSTPFDPPLNKDKYLHTTNVLTGIDSIIGNLEEFYSTVYKNHNINRKQYVIQRYDLGLSKLEEQHLKNGKQLYIRKAMTPNDSMTVKSLLMLPEPVIRFSSIELPTTDILSKATLHQNYFMLFRFLKKNLDIIPHVINDLSRELDYEKMEKDMKKDFFSGVHEFILSNEVIVDKEEKMNKFLDVIIPKTRFLIRIIRKHLKDKLSFIDVVQQLEPFGVYPSDISYKQYMEIRHIIKERITEVRDEIEKRSINFAILRNAKYEVAEKPNPILRVLTEKKDFSEEFFKAYGLKGKELPVSSSEILVNMIKSDNGVLYTNTLTSILISLMTLLLLIFSTFYIMLMDSSPG